MQREYQGENEREALQKPGRKHPPTCLLIQEKNILLQGLPQVKPYIYLRKWLHLQESHVVWTNTDLAL